MASFVLVHGSWHGAWCWERVRRVLEDQGHRVVSPDLPAHGDDPTPPHRATLRRYSAAIRAAARANREPAVVVGHSMGGVASAQAVADEPDLFRALVYLCAFVPLDGDRLLSLHRRDAASLVGKSTSWGWRGVEVRRERATELFYGDCDPATATHAISRLRPDPYLPAFARCRFPRSKLEIPQSYIECTQDRAISIEHQRAMARRAGVEVIASMETSHSPFLSASEELARHLESDSERISRAAC